MIRVSRVATDDDINKGNSIYKLVRKLCSTVTLVRKLMCLMMIGSFVSWRARKESDERPCGFCWNSLAINALKKMHLNWLLGLVA